ncbi:aldehyde dehydrogenase family protein [Amycolatopsis panacis]|uniref:aldehyde dehydrogenase (NAD(+)) n=1 Tax=Amycolatopsis panacis TaxID=2340917 RepID=A0A419I9U0_9PSEU|nr:aldehyde dehydrogenase family protein [Amycolatopsis panacis]RJQ89276.1 aldehyde dehydrogenase family protein [Amycolatopsis panacis]
MNGECVQYDKLFIGGDWVSAHQGAEAEVINAADETVLATVCQGDAQDVDTAVAAARAAVDSGALADPAARIAALRAVREALAERQDRIAELISLEVGTPAKISRRIQVGLPLAVLDAFAETAGRYEWQTTVGNSTVLREPAGVIGAITPWNYPLHQLVAKVGAAIAAGCAVVAKPAGVAPLSAFALAEAVSGAGLPDGVFNLVPGSGGVVGEAIAGHPGVDVVSFTGSTEAGTRVARLAAATITKVALELGGKSANVLLDDADLARAVKTGVGNAFLNSGQTCSAWTRMLVPARLQDQVVDLAVQSAKRLTVGHPLDENTRLGPLASAGQRENVRGYIDAGRAEGARLVCGGTEPPAGLSKGFYVEPTIFADVGPAMRIAREEIFGPVLAIMPYDDEEDAIRIANDSDYGLAGGVWSADTDRAWAVARRMRTGQVDINGGAFNPAAPFGGYKKSGLGREFGTFGIDEFVEIKSVQS